MALTKFGGEKTLSQKLLEYCSIRSIGTHVRAENESEITRHAVLGNLKKTSF